MLSICCLSGTHDVTEPFNSQNFMSNPPYCLPYNLCDVKFENLELDQPIILKLIFVLILVTCLLYVILIV